MADESTNEDGEDYMKVWEGHPILNLLGVGKDWALGGGNGSI